MKSIPVSAGAALAVLAAMLLPAWLGMSAAIAAPAVTLKATLITPDDDTRMERSRVERAYLGHPGGPLMDGIEVAIEESQFELDAANVGVVVTPQAAKSLEAARAAAMAAEKAGAAVLLTDLPAAWTLAVADAVKLPVINLSETADSLRQQDCRARLFHMIRAALPRS